jgi:tetratricopeptide (TPR) repeat protein
MRKRKDRRGHLHVTGRQERQEPEPDEVDNSSIPAGLERALRRIMSGKKFTSLEEANQFFDELRGDMLSSVDQSAFAGHEDELEELLAEADLEDEPAGKRRLIELALQADPRHPGALISMSALEDGPEGIKLLEQAIESAADRLGPAFFDNPGDPEDFPDLADAYISANILLGERLRLEGRHEDAIKKLQTALLLTPGDEDVAETLVTEFLIAGDYDIAGKLLDSISESASALFIRSILEHLRGNEAAAGAALRRARKANVHVTGYLLQRLPLPHEPSFSDRPGSKGEAQLCIFRLMPLLAAKPEALRWFQERLDR